MHSRPMHQPSNNVIPFPVRPRVSIAWYRQLLDHANDPDVIVAAYLEVRAIAQSEGFNLQLFDELYPLPPALRRLVDVS